MSSVGGNAPQVQYRPIMVASGQTCCKTHVMYVCVGAPPSTCNAYLLLLLMELPNKLPYSPLSCNGGHASGGYNILKFNNIFVPIEAKTQSQLSGLCVVCSKTHRDMHNDVKFSARCCSNVPNTHRSNSGLGVLCNNTLEH